MLKIPPINEDAGEIYAGALIKPDGTGHHIILLDGDADNASWHTQMEWAKSIGGDLPARTELAHLNAHLNAQFKKDFYWSNEQHEYLSYFAWSQYFNDGLQYYWLKTSFNCARAVRRVAIG